MSGHFRASNARRLKIISGFLDSAKHNIYLLVVVTVLGTLLPCLWQGISSNGVFDNLWKSLLVAVGLEYAVFIFEQVVNECLRPNIISKNTISDIVILLHNVAVNVSKYGSRSSDAEYSLKVESESFRKELHNISNQKLPLYSKDANSLWERQKEIIESSSKNILSIHTALKLEYAKRWDKNSEQQSGNNFYEYIVEPCKNSKSSRKCRLFICLDPSAANSEYLDCMQRVEEFQQELNFKTRYIIYDNDSSNDLFSNMHDVLIGDKEAVTFENIGWSAEAHWIIGDEPFRKEEEYFNKLWLEAINFESYIRKKDDKLQ